MPGIGLHLGIRVWGLSVLGFLFLFCTDLIAGARHFYNTEQSTSKPTSHPDVEHAGEADLSDFFFKNAKLNSFLNKFRENPRSIHFPFSVLSDAGPVSGTAQLTFKNGIVILDDIPTHSLLEISNNGITLNSSQVFTGTYLVGSSQGSWYDHWQKHSNIQHHEIKLCRLVKEIHRYDNETVELVTEDVPTSSIIAGGEIDSHILLLGSEGRGFRRLETSFCEKYCRENDDYFNFNPYTSILGYEDAHYYSEFGNYQNPGNPAAQIFCEASTSLDGCYEYTDVEHMSFNYDKNTQQAAKTTLSIAQGISCQNCYMYLGHEIIFYIQWSYSTVTIYRAYFSGSFELNAQIELDNPSISGTIEQGLVDLFTIVSFDISAGLSLTLKGKLDASVNGTLSYSGSLSKKLYFSTKGYVESKYDGVHWTNGIEPANLNLLSAATFDSGYQNTQGCVSARATVTLIPTVIIEIGFSGSSVSVVSDPYIGFPIAITASLSSPAEFSYGFSVGVMAGVAPIIKYVIPLYGSGSWGTLGPYRFTIYKILASSGCTCSPNCAICTSSSVCSSCSRSYYLYQSTCYSTCPHGTMISGSKCSVQQTVKPTKGNMLSAAPSCKGTPWFVPMIICVVIYVVN